MGELFGQIFCFLFHFLLRPIVLPHGRASELSRGFEMNFAKGLIFRVCIPGGIGIQIAVAEVRAIKTKPESGSILMFAIFDTSEGQSAMNTDVHIIVVFPVSGMAGRHAAVTPAVKSFAPLDYCALQSVVIPF